MKATRCLDEPLIHRDLDSSLGNNINGPSLIRVPDWLPDPLGRYYLYFAHHNGLYIRLAYADELLGPWRVHRAGVLPVADSSCSDHVASPDVHVDHQARQIVMYFHGVAFAKGATDGHENRFGAASRWIGNQRTKRATSNDGLNFTAEAQPLGASYFRVFQWAGQRHALAMPGVFYRADVDGSFLAGPMPFGPSFRHCGVHLDGSRLNVFFTRVGDTPESILHTVVDLRPDWHQWTHGEVRTVLRPELPWEGGQLAAESSARGPVFDLAHQLRDPACFLDGEDRYLLYAGGGEQAIGIARLEAE